MRLWELEEGDEGNGGARFEGARGWEAAIAAANEADAHAVQAAENPAAPPAPNQNNPAMPPAPMPPRADVDPPLIVAMNQLRVAAPQDQRHPHPNQNNRNANANQARRARLPAGGDGADGAGGRHVRFHGNARVGQDDALQRFLAAAQADEEDGWDSDELDDNGDEAWEIPER